MIQICSRCGGKKGVPDKGYMCCFPCREEQRTQRNPKNNPKSQELQSIAADLGFVTSRGGRYSSRKFTEAQNTVILSEYESRKTPPGAGGRPARLILDIKTRGNGDTRRGSTGHITPKTVFVDSIENLQNIVNAAKGSSHSRSSGIKGTRKKPTFEERKLQNKIRKYAESIGFDVVQWDFNGNPDHEYMFPIGRLWYRCAAEIKAPGKKPERHQAKMILELLNKMAVRVFSDFLSAKKWLDDQKKIALLEAA